MTPLRLLAGSAALLVAALVSWAVLAVGQGDHRWPDGAVVPVDGEPHLVDLGSDRPAMLWAYDADATPRCAVAGATGEARSLDPDVGSYQRPGGSAGDWVGLARFDPGAAVVEVTCALDDGEGSEGSAVAVETAPVLPPPLAALGAWGALPAGLGLAAALGAAMVAVQGLRRLVRARHHGRRGRTGA